MALATALAIAGATGVRLGSPTPLAPKISFWRDMPGVDTHDPGLDSIAHYGYEQISTYIL